MKFIKCPRCNNANFSEQWIGPGRKLSQFCQSCGWRGEPRTPEQKIINGKTEMPVNNGRYAYHLYDKYGHIIIYSQSFASKEEAMQDLSSVIKCFGKSREEYPYTAVLFPPVAEVQGEIFKQEDFEDNENECP